MSKTEKENSADLDIINNNIKTDLQIIESEVVFIFCDSLYDAVGITEFYSEEVDWIDLAHTGTSGGLL